MPAAALDHAQQQRIREVFSECGNITHTARLLKLDRNTVRKYLLGDDAAPAFEPATLAARTIPFGAPVAPELLNDVAGFINAMPAAKHETRAAPAAAFPDAHREEYTPHVLDRAGTWLILSDIHAPYHDRTTIELAVTEAKRRNAVGVILNGDTLDSHEVSRHDKDPGAPRYVEEVEIGRNLLAWVRSQFPWAELVLKEGNHEERLASYIIGRAPALFGLEGLDIPGLLHFADVGATWVSGRRVIALGKLNVIHGHEFPGGCTSPVNPARGLYLKARSVALCGHHHQSSFHPARNIRGQVEAAWSVGCACFLSPKYMPLNNWNLGYAIVEVAADGSFQVENRMVMGGKVV